MVEIIAHYLCKCACVCVSVHKLWQLSCLLLSLSLSHPYALSVTDFDGLSYPLNWSRAPRGNTLAHVNAFERVKIWVGIIE